MRKILDSIQVAIGVYITYYLYINTIGRERYYMPISIEPMIERVMYIVGAVTLIQLIKLFIKDRR
jgi:hypothetical protein